MSINRKKFIENYVKIRTKDSKIVPFIINSPQQKLYDIIKEQKQNGKPVRIIILKARQMGFSTMTEGLIYTETSVNKLINSGIITHSDVATNNLFNMFKLMYEQVPGPLKPELKASNAKELIFDNEKGTGLKSKIKCMTAGSNGVGRSDTFNNLHLSELAFWPGDVKQTMTGLLQAVPNLPNTMLIVESTANGFNYFKTMWDQAVNRDNDFIPLFVGWNELPEYTMKYTGFDLTSEEIQLKKQFNLTDDQLTWRRWCIKNNCSGDIDQFKQEYPITPEEAFIATGNCVFDQQLIIDRLKSVPDPIDVGMFKYDYINEQISNIKWVSDKTGPIKIWKIPVDNMFYVIGGDTSGEGSDYFVGDVIDNQTGEQVAMYRNVTDETLYAHQMYCLGKYYNNSLIGIETNYSTYPIKELERLGYSHMYVRQKVDSITHNVTLSYGVCTDKKTRPIIIGHVQDLMRDHIEDINDPVTLREGLTFIKNDNGRPEAIEGSHDDTIMCLGISHYIRNQQDVYIVKKTHEVKFKWSDDLKEDYYNADSEIQERMLEKYGQIN